jgi:hypothetical protein
MKKFDELLEKLKKLNITQERGDWEENIPEEIWNEYFNDNYSCVASGLEIDTHRWYECSTEVIEIFGRYLGIHFLTNSFSESQEIRDCDVIMDFYEMEEINTVSYKKMITK